VMKICDATSRDWAPGWQRLLQTKPFLLYLFGKFKTEHKLASHHDLENLRIPLTLREPSWREKFKSIVRNYVSSWFTSVSETASLGVEVGSTIISTVCKAVELKPGASVRIVRDVYNFTTRKIYAIAPYVPSKFQFCENTADNLKDALLTRQCRLRPLMTEDGENRLRHTANSLKLKVDVLMDFGEWLESRVWSKVKKLMADREFTHYIPRLNVAARSHFVKPDFVLNKFKESAGRLVTTYATQIQSILGPMLVSIKKATQHPMNWSGFNVRFVGGKTREEIGTMFQEAIDNCPDCYFFSGDFEKFDSSISPKHINLESRVSKSMLPKTYNQYVEWYNAIESSNVKAGAKTRDGYVTSRVPASRGSGSPATYLGNTVLAALCVVTELRQFVSPHNRDLVTILISGDDVLIVAPLPVIRELMQRLNNFRDYGHVLEATYTNDPCKVRFLQGFFCPQKDLEGFVLVPDFMRVVRKTPLMVEGRQTKETALLAASKCSGMMDCFYWFEPLWRVYQRYQKHLIKKYNLKNIPPKERKWLSFGNNYELDPNPMFASMGLNDQDIYSLTHYLEHFDVTGSLKFDHPVFNRLLPEDINDELFERET